MSRYWVRLSCVLIMLAMVFGSGYRVFRAEQQRNIDRNAARKYDTLAGTLAITLGDLRSAQRAYVASGQTPSDWFGSVATHLETLSLGFQELGGMSRTEAATEWLREAEEVIDRVRRVDETARAHATAGRTLMASDLVFTDGQQLVLGVSELLGRARLLEADGWSARIDGHRAAQLRSIAAAVATAVLAAFVLLPLPRRQPNSDPAPAPLQEEGSADPLEDLAADAAVHPDQVELRTPPATPDTEGALAARILADLKRTAQVCSDLGRVTEADGLQAVLEQARDVLDASGLIVWVRDGSGSALRAATGDGYPPQVLSRFGHVACDAENATAVAYRTAELQVVPGESEHSASLAVPLLSSSTGAHQCIGVLSAEVAAGRETNEALQATASILAAQLATILSVDPVEAEFTIEDTPSVASGSSA